MTKKLQSVAITALTVLFLAVMLALPASAATSISKAVITFTSSHSYTGSYIKPKVTVKLKGKKISNKNYTVTYKNNKNVGTATLTVKGKGSYNGSVTKKFYITPASPKKLKATADVNSVKLSWNKSVGAASYQVEMYNTSTKKWVNKTTVKTTSATVKKLQPGTIYKFRVRAYKKAGKELYSPYSNLTVKTKVAKVGSVKATATASSVALSWGKVKNATGYQVYMYDTAGKKWVRKKTLAASSVTITGLKGTTSYKFKIRARNTLNDKTVYGAYSDELTVTTLPGAVKNVQITATGATSATVKWDAVAKATGYDVYIGKTADASKAPVFTKVKTTTATSYKAADLDTCCYYVFRITSRYKLNSKTVLYGDSSKSLSKQIFLPVTKVQNIDLKVTANTYATMTWKSQPYCSGYYVYLRKDSEGTVNQVAVLGPSQSSYTFKNLEELTAYRFYIRAFYKDKSGKITEGARDGISAVTDDGSVEAVNFTSAKSSLNIGSSYTFKASVVPSWAANKKVSFSSSNTSVATVDSKGLVKALSAGTATITVKSDEGGFTDKITLKVNPIKSTGISLSAITAYLNEITLPEPVFTPANTTDKSFTITGKDYTYSYSGFLGITQTDTYKFTDYVTVNSDGSITAKKLTINTKTNEPFSFTVTVKANDTGVTTTARLTVKERQIKIEVTSSLTVFECGSTMKFNVTLGSGVSFTKNQLIWQSSDNSVAYIDSEGTVYGTGSGWVTITAYSPDKSMSHSEKLFVRPKINPAASFYAGCVIGDEIQLEVETLPENTECYFYSLSPEILSVDENGLVTVLAEGTATVVVSAKNAVEKSIIFTSEAWQAPATDSQSLLDEATEKLNSVKADMPRLIRSSSSVFTNFYMSKPSSELSASDLEEMFLEFADPSTVVVSKVASTATEAEKLSYRKNIPVSGSSLAILSGLTTDDLQSIRFIDEGKATYDIALTLKSEGMSSPTYDGTSTRHGKVFDILSGPVLDSYINTLNSGSSTDSGKLEVSYSSFSQNYSNSAVTLTVDKITGEVEHISYDMNIAVNISNLNISMGIITAINSDLAFNVNNKIEIDVIN